MLSIFKIVQSCSNPQEATDRLVASACEVMKQGEEQNIRSKPDDITVAVVKALKN